MAKKRKKHRPQAPSLSSFDKFLYWLLASCSLLIGCFFLPILYRVYYDQCFEDPSLLAQSDKGFIFGMMYWLFLWIGIAAVLLELRSRKQPIFGKKGITYGPPKWKAVYPLFSRTFWKHFLANRKRVLITAVAALLVTSLTTGVTMASLFARDQLYNDGSIRGFNFLNQQVQHCTASDVVEIHICTEYDSNGNHRIGRFGIKRRGSWGIQLRIHTNDGIIYFDDRHFRPDQGSMDESLIGMLQIKALFDPDQIVIVGTDKIPRVIADQEFTQEEAQLLYDLFDMRPE